MEKTTRNTRQRTVILETLREMANHPTADEIFTMTRALLPRISLGTVYRNLELLTRQGDIRCLENSSSQKRFDGTLMPHHHVRCTRCGRLGDIDAEIPLPPVDSVTVDGFTLTRAQVVFEGICSHCAR